MSGTTSQDRHGQRSDHRAKNASGAAVQTGAADDDGRDDIQFNSDGGAGVTLAQAGKLHDAGDAEENSGEGVNADLNQASSNAAQARCGFVRADGKDVSAENGSFHDDGHDDGQVDGNRDAG